MPAAVKPSVRNTAFSTPSRAPSQPQTSLPAAPPVKIRVNAIPIVGRSAPFSFSRNGRKVRNPIRVALSIIAIDSSSGNPRPLAAGCPVAAVFSAAATGRLSRPGRPRTLRITAAAASAKHAEQQCRALPRHQRDETRGQSRKRHFPEIAGEIVAGERGARAPSGKRLRDEMGRDRVLHGGAGPGQHQRHRQHAVSGADPGREKPDPDQRRAEPEHERPADPLGQHPGRHLQARHRAGEQARAISRPRHSRDRTAPARSAAARKAGRYSRHAAHARRTRPPSCAAPAPRTGPSLP